jgi:DNA adenine methylase
VFIFFSRNHLTDIFFMKKYLGINSWARYPGGKSKKAVRAQILAYKPYKTKEFREPFVGGGGIFFGINPQQIHNRWINDINPHLISVYEAFRDRAADFIRACREIEPEKPNEEQTSTKTANGAKYNKRLGEIFKKFAADQKMDQALRYFFINRTVWAGRVNYDPTKTSRLYYSNPSGWNIVTRPGYLESVAALLKNTVITVGSYQRLLTQDGEDVWIYLDPPYVADTEFVATDKLYQFGFSEQDHEDFARACGATKHKICISYDDCRLVRDLFEGAKACGGDKKFHLYEHSWKYSGSSLAKKVAGKELIITNYERPGEQAALEKEYLGNVFEGNE